MLTQLQIAEYKFNLRQYKSFDGSCLRRDVRYKSTISLLEKLKIVAKEARRVEVQRCILQSKELAAGTPALDYYSRGKNMKIFKITTQFF